MTSTEGACDSIGIHLHSTIKTVVATINKPCRCNQFLRLRDVSIAEIVSDAIIGIGAPANVSCLKNYGLQRNRRSVEDVVTHFHYFLSCQVRFLMTKCFVDADGWDRLAANAVVTDVWMVGITLSLQYPTQHESSVFNFDINFFDETEWGTCCDSDPFQHFKTLQWNLWK